MVNDDLEKLIESDKMHKGFTGTAGGFYGPQGRVLRLAIQDNELNKKMDAFNIKIFLFEIFFTKQFSIIITCIYITFPVTTLFLKSNMVFQEVNHVKHNFYNVKRLGYQ